jgi:hypothetical protein
MPVPYLDARNRSIWYVWMKSPRLTSYALTLSLNFTMTPSLKPTALTMPDRSSSKKSTRPSSMIWLRSTPTS